MSILPEAKLDVLLAHHASLEAQLLSQMSSENYVKITRELSELNPLIEAVKTYRAANAELAGIDALISDPTTDPEMRGMAEAERETLVARSLELAQQIRVALLPKDAMDDRNVVLEIPKDAFEHEFEAVKKAKGVRLDTDLDEAALRDVEERYKKVVKARAKREFPQDPREQLKMARDAVFRSWMNPRAQKVKRDLQGRHPFERAAASGAGAHQQNGLIDEGKGA